MHIRFSVRAATGTVTPKSRARSPRTLAFAMISAGVLSAAVGPTPGLAQVRSCAENPKPAFCNAVRGDRAQGWLPQTRSEVVSRNGIVATSQALAAESGMEILKQGGNAIDAAVAAAAVLNLVEPTSTGVGSDVFAVVYIAKENKLHFLNASGTAPTGATLQRYNCARLFLESGKNFAFGSGMPRRNPVGDRSGCCVGLGRTADQVRTR